jgi:hypothetical protein
LKRDAHYYALLAFSRACGFKKASAHDIAYASQFVDDAKINLIFIEKENLGLEHDFVANRPAFFNIATCHSYFRINTFNYEAMVNNTSAFHFVPGCKGKSFTKRLRCKEEAPVILDILNDVFLEADIIKFGIVLHAYADTFAHQGFSGMLSKVNAINNCKAEKKMSLRLFNRLPGFLRRFGQEKYEEYLDRFMPAYGHGQAMEFPDLPYLVWSYQYDHSDDFNGSSKQVKIDNRDRYKRAFERIRWHLEKFLLKYPQYRDKKVNFNNFNLLFDTLIYEGSDQQRENNWKKTLVNQGLFSKEDKVILNYKNDLWLKEAFTNYSPKVFNNRRVEGAQLSTHFKNSNWYRFVLAVKWYKKNFFKYCSKYQLHIPN